MPNVITSGVATLQFRPVTPLDNSDRRLPKIEPAWEVDSLSPLEARFVEKYVFDRNATESARQAGYSDTTATKKAHKLLNRPDVRKAIELSERTMMARLPSHAGHGPQILVGHRHR